MRRYALLLIEPFRARVQEIDAKKELTLTHISLFIIMHINQHLPLDLVCRQIHGIF